MSSRRNRIMRENEKEKENTILLTEEIKELNDVELNNNKPIFDSIMENSYYFLNKCGNYFFVFIHYILKVSGIYISWIILHFIASHLYTRFCVPNSIIGFLMSPFLTATPHCQGLRWIIYNAANVINNMWLVLGAWLCSTLFVINKETGPHDN